MKLDTSKSASLDFVEGLMAWRLWMRFGWHDIVARYRRSWVGPLWLIATIAIFVLALAFVYSTLFKVSLVEYLPFVAVGAVVWNFISAICSESVMTFVESEAYIRQVRRSPFVYVFRVVWRNVIVFANQFVVAFAVILFFVNVTFFHALLAILGIALLLLQTLWIVPLLGIIGARFRDLLPIIQSVLQIFFFITPVIWPAKALAGKEWVALFNPFHHIIDLVRAPLLGTEPAFASYIVVAAVTVVGFAAAHLFYGRFRARIIYWL
ncbi:ABC transporter permease [Bosea sp. LjRoot90]|uniref:ABC transporter permease n=1 Tax=Bosea sp. LjRoot90 TaxID=3342342 RepID=UPI003ECC8718